MSDVNGLLAVQPTLSTVSKWPMAPPPSSADERSCCNAASHQSPKQESSSLVASPSFDVASAPLRLVAVRCNAVARDQPARVAACCSTLRTAFSVCCPCPLAARMRRVASVAHERSVSWRWMRAVSTRAPKAWSRRASASPVSMPPDLPPASRSSAAHRGSMSSRMGLRQADHTTDAGTAAKVGRRRRSDKRTPAPLPLPPPTSHSLQLGASL
mmetsp:Transcript_8050/g.25089  ORF Transcript_8050/g.25089 Transcript_8050/m.25089 type:complete len:213 (-) Transcript_8050:1634-2272(-)|eukprot:scaffold308102_cov30-Tisochrysis_lutea.AAC.3